MPKDYIGKALTRLSQFSPGGEHHGADLCDIVAKELNRMPPGEVRSLNRDLNFFFVGLRTRGADLGGNTPEEIADLRRAAKLLVNSLKPAPPGLNIADADGWSYATLQGVLRAFGRARATYQPAGTGFYLKGSFWGFSSQSERQWMRDAWGEALHMLDCGRLVAVRGRLHNSEESRLVQKWFGASDRFAVETNTRTIMSRMLDQHVGICYLGPGLKAGYREYGPEAILNNLRSSVRENDTEIGFAAPQALGKQLIGFKASFFQAQTAAVRRSTLHDETLRRVLNCTRAGAVVHELSHVFLTTRDHPLPDSVYTFFNLPFQPPRSFAYGPRACHGLAQNEPALALTNADSYRLFCEDAQVHVGL